MVKMGGSTTCIECHKKLKVFSRKKTCAQCKEVICKYCFELHSKKHGGNGVSISLKGFGNSTNHHSHHHSHYARSDDEHEEEVHFFSDPRLSADSPQSQTLSDIGAEFVESGEDDEEEEEDDEEEDLFLVNYKGRLSLEEQQRQHREFKVLQEAIAKWARREMEFKRQHKVAKQTPCYTISPVNDIKATRKRQKKILFSITYALVITLGVWIFYGLIAGAYFVILRENPKWMRTVLHYL